MAITAVQKAAIEKVIDTLVHFTSARGKRQLSEMFMQLPDKEAWPEYYEVIPDPMCIDGVKTKLEKNKYKAPLDVHADLTIVFLNALFYNEEGSQISKDATTLKSALETEWKSNAILPAPRESPPDSAPPSPPKPPPAPQIDTPATSAPPPADPLPAVPPPPPPRARSPVRQSSPDMEVDVSGTTPEADGGADDMHTARDDESDEIVRQLERGLPRWDGFGDMGWMAEINPDKYLAIVHAIKTHEDSTGKRVAQALEEVPEQPLDKNLSYHHPLSLSLIESRAQSKSYPSSKAFDIEFARLFEKARRFHEPGSENYGNVLLLQRLYQAITSSSPPSGPPYKSTTNFASVRAGPGTARPLHQSSETEGVAGVTTFRVSSKDRTFVEQVDYKGWTFRLADWVHLSNPDDPSRPIIGQIFKCYVSDEPSKKGQPGVTACWYYRPEQTIHPAHRQFWENEVFKTSHFADHPLEDIIEKIACQFTARHIRGRPRPPYWYPGWPMYVCDSRYNDRERVFVRIKNWNSCVPEEVRKSTEFMPIYPFERAVFPRRFESPFLNPKLNIKGPGGIGDSVERADGEKIEGGGTGRKRARRTPGGATPKVDPTDVTGPRRGLYVGTVPQQTTNNLGSLYTHQPLQIQQPQPTQARPEVDRSILTAAGGAAGLGGNVFFEKLPPETVRHFDRDPETNEVLWFAAPPIDIPHTPAPRYSLTYLHYLASKRKAAQVNGVAMDVNSEQSIAVKRRRVQARPRVTETLERIWTEVHDGK